MKKLIYKNINIRDSINFRKWTRKNYAVFNSLKKVIKISSIIIGYSLVSKPVISQVITDTIVIGQSVDLDEVTIESTRVPLIYSEVARVVTIITADDIEQSPVNGVSDLLNYSINVDVRQRGLNDVQSDVSIRGGSFEQTLILLNGIMVNDPQTGHHNMDLPISLNDIEKIEILEGPGSRIFGPNAFSGAINIITKTETKNKFGLDASAGSYGSYNTSVSGNINSGKFNNYLSVSKKASNGHIHNTDFTFANIFYNGNVKSNFGDLDYQAGYTEKAFGANNFYGSKSYPDQFERTKTYFTSLKYKATTNSIRYNQNLYYKLHKDYFTIIREKPEIWTNNHLTAIYGLGGSININNKIGISSLGYEFRQENILSNVLGESMIDSIEVKGEPGFYYYREGQRNYISLYAEHFYEYERFTISGGILANYNNHFNLSTSPGIDISYRISNGMKLYGTWNRSIRLPTYTELYYDIGDQKGNPDLLPERAETIEIGTKYSNRFIHSHLSLFKRRGYDLIDWVNPDNDIIWETMNLTKINSYGLGLFLKIKPTIIFDDSFPVKKITVSYSYIKQDKPGDELRSRYVMDYLKHKGTIGLDHVIYKNIGASWRIMAQDRAGTYTAFYTLQEKKYEPFITIDGKLSWKFKRISFFIETLNIMGIKYYDFGNIQMPGRSFQIGLKLNFTSEQHSN